ncbi:MAG: hypothetical protein ACOZBH_01540 [Patescibacteria group bacterium]
MEEKNLKDEVAELKQLVRRNIEYTQELRMVSDKTRKYILWIQIINLFKLLIILVPLILALIYLPPLIRDFVEKYKELFGSSGFFLDMFNR